MEDKIYSTIKTISKVNVGREEIHFPEKFLNQLAEVFYKYGRYTAEVFLNDKINREQKGSRNRQNYYLLKRKILPAIIDLFSYDERVAIWILRKLNVILAHSSNFSH